uniref:Uncharacterized protein n=1 Tax=Arthrobacter sp. J3.37 TaxID=347208 RepID=I3W0V1_9MICC|nr:hypothetical protein [Arthrobacter sp. J3.37]AFK89228.1 hypothetical protein [Arthrobacter sp. J3.37]
MPQSKARKKRRQTVPGRQEPSATALRPPGVPVPDPNSKAVVFFFPLPEALRFPAGETISLLIPDDPTNDFPSEHFATEGGIDLHRTYALTLHHIDRSVSDSDVVIVTELALQKVTSRPPRKKKTAIPLKWRVTVAEVRCVIDHASGHTREKAFDAALQTVNDILQGYHLATKELVSLLTKESLPVLVPMVEETSDGTFFLSNYIGGEQGKRGVAGRRSGTLEPNTAPLTQKEQDVLRGALLMLQAGVMGEFIDVQREAYIAYRSGNFILASILLGLAAELLVKETVTLMLWERGMPLPEAKRSLSALGHSRTFAKEAKARLLEFLGDAWTPEMEDAHGFWRKDLAPLRNSAMHEGHRPTDEEMRAAVTAYSRFQKALLKAIASKSAEYPVSATMTGGFNLLNPASTSGLRLKLNRWRMEIDRLNTKPEGDLSGSAVYLVVSGGDERQWFVINHGNELAAQIPDQTVPKYVEKMINDLVLAGRQTPYHFEMADLVPPSDLDSKDLLWTPLYKAFPVVYALRFQPPAP